MHFSLALSGLLRLLENLLDNLLLLNQESTDNAVLDTSGAAGTTVGTADVLLGAGDLGVFTGTKGGNLENIIVSVLSFLLHRNRGRVCVDSAARSSFSLSFVHHRNFFFSTEISNTAKSTQPARLANPKLHLEHLHQGA